MAQQLGALAVPPEDQVQYSHICGKLFQPSLTPNVGWILYPSGIHKHCMHMVPRHACRKKNT